MDPRRAHALDVATVDRVACVCGHEGPPGPLCAGCGVAFAAYFCAACKLYDERGVADGYWHCDGCGRCRRGGAANFWHCATCVACLPLASRDGHRCLPRVLDGRCALCFDAMAGSRVPCAALRCGHFMHAPCIDEMLRGGQWRCPQCNKAAVDMAGVWARLDAEVAATPMPAEYDGVRVSVVCADCNTSGDAPFHVVGLRCGACGGYNTARGGALRQPDRAPTPPVAE